MDQQMQSDTSQILKKAFKGMADEVQKCIQSCTACHQVCLQAISHCLEKGGEHASPTHIRTLEDCAEICSVSANFMMRGSDLHPAICGACAEACLACADSCEKIADSDEMMKACANICRLCAESCQKMSAHH